MQSACLCVRYNLSVVPIFDLAEACSARLWPRRVRATSTLEQPLGGGGGDGEALFFFFFYRYFRKCTQLLSCACMSAVRRRRVCMFCLIAADRCHSWATQAFSSEQEEEVRRILLLLKSHFEFLAFQEHKLGKSTSFPAEILQFLRQIASV